MELEFMSDAPVGASELFIYLDDEGAQQIVRAIEAARTTGHEHLMTQQWGGRGLTASDGSTRTFHKVTVTFGAQERGNR